VDKVGSERFGQKREGRFSSVEKRSISKQSQHAAPLPVVSGREPRVCIREYQRASHAAIRRPSKPDLIPGPCLLNIASVGVPLLPTQIQMEKDLDPDHHHTSTDLEWPSSPWQALRAGYDTYASISAQPHIPRPLIIQPAPRPWASIPSFPFLDFRASLPATASATLLP